MNLSTSTDGCIKGDVIVITDSNKRCMTLRIAILNKPLATICMYICKNPNMKTIYLLLKLKLYFFPIKNAITLESLYAFMSHRNLSVNNRQVQYNKTKSSYQIV